MMPTPPLDAMVLSQARFIELRAGVRYWEDASLNGVKDTEGTIPLRVGDDWAPVIELAMGRVLDWPEGLEATTCYKVCDNGDYWLLDADRKRIAKWKRYYVPAAFFDTSMAGYGSIASDYIVLSIGCDGLVANWRNPPLDAEQWVPV
ncbi:hypothetical protein [Paraburkholderia sp. A3RO-2L]|uniref:hypothetical protein n=1 Tax=Paraburkholderia sp. A3RO-2L TaxID=3028376 RepID=UPI003DA9C0BF